MYHVIINHENERIDDYFTTKREVIQFIAQETGATQSSIRDEIEARADSIIHRDSNNWRAQIMFTK